MKKLFIAAMALAAMVSCSKEDDLALLESGSKSVTITIGNAVDATRADYTGGDTTAGTPNQTACAQATDLKVLFVNSNDVVLKELPLTAQADADAHPEDTPEYTPGKSDNLGTYVWHNVPWDVTKIAVVRYEPGDITVTGTTTLNDFVKIATDEEKNVARELEDIVLYGTNALSNTGETHQVGDYIYHVWSTTVVVEPLLARVEISGLSCSDLGDYNWDKNDDGTLNNSTMGFDEIAVKSMIWTSTSGANTYSTIVPANSKILGTLYGSYVDGPNTPEEHPGVKKSLNPSKAWSWNVDPAKTQFGSMKVDMDVLAYDYNVVKTNQPLNITGLSTKAPGTEGGQTEDVNFVKGNIYKFSIPFTESDIKTTEDGLCVEVTVEIAKWTVNPVYPIFGN